MACARILLLLILSNFSCPKPSCIHNKPSNHQIIYIQDNLNQHETRRILAQEKPHPIRIFGHYLPSTIKSPSFSTVYNMFSIASMYYSKVLKVNYLSDRQTLFPQRGLRPSSPCDQLMDPNYISLGFNQSLADMVVFITFRDSPDFIAEGSSCVFARRPTYGCITFTTSSVSLRSLSQFHQAVQLTIHELTHLLGFLQDFFDNFYESPWSNAKRPIDQVVAVRNGRSMIITPKVLEYVQRYFVCNDGMTGGLLEDEGIKTAAMNHWEKLVYRDQLMNPAVWPSGLRITQLTLALLSDTNFYQSVDLSFAQPVDWGSKRGCSFAQGSSPQLWKFCQLRSACDYYSRFIRQCEKDIYSNNYKVEGSAEYSVCDRSDNTNPNLGLYSRCFIKGNGSALCLKSLCDSSGKTITIYLGNRSGQCKSQNQKINFTGTIIDCPTNFKAFCSYRSCKNWCSGKGLCLNSRCVCIHPWVGQSCQTNSLIKN